MSPTIEKLLLQITYVCLHINAQGKWHAFISISGHVHQIDVWLLPASTIYKEGEPHERAFSESVYFRREPRHGWQTAAEQEARIGAELLAMLANLEPFLTPESSEVAA